MTNVTCKGCGWVHFEVSREYAEAEVKRFNEYFNSLDPIARANFCGLADIIDYEICGLCGRSYEDMRDYKDGDCPPGVTIGPIIKRTE